MRCRGRRHLAIINGRCPPVFQANHHETAAAEISRRGMGHGQREGDGNRGINSVAATLHDVDADFRSDFVGRSDNAMTRADGFA